MPIDDILPNAVDVLFREVLAQRLNCTFSDEYTTRMFNSVSHIDFDPSTGEFSLYIDGVPHMTSNSIGEEKFQEMVHGTGNVTETEQETLKRRCVDNINDDMLMLYNAFKHKLMCVYYCLDIDQGTTGSFSIVHAYASPEEDQVPFDAYLSGMGKNILNVMWTVIGSKLDEDQKKVIRPIFESEYPIPLIPGIPFDTPPAIQAMMMISHQLHRS
jgi:hypothetical protein